MKFRREVVGADLFMGRQDDFTASGSGDIDYSDAGEMQLLRVEP